MSSMVCAPMVLSRLRRAVLGMGRDGTAAVPERAIRTASTITPLAGHGRVPARQPVTLAETRARHDRAAATGRLTSTTTKRLRVATNRLQVAAMKRQTTVWRRARRVVPTRQVATGPTPAAPGRTPVVVLQASPSTTAPKAQPPTSVVTALPTPD